MDDKRKKIAAALRYEPGRDSAPVVVAAGQGRKAEKIKEIAENAGVPVHRDEALARTLHDLGIGVEIPPRLYQAVAAILVFVAGVDGQKKSTQSPGKPGL